MSVYVDHKLKLTYEDLKQIPEDDPYRHEIIDGVHVSMPSPVYRHQTISRRIQFQLYRQIEEPGYGEVVDAPMDVELSLFDILEPDVLVILTANRAIVTPIHVIGAPDLVIEILSPSTAGRDLGIKRERYARAGVPTDYRTVGRFHDEVNFQFPVGVARVDLHAVWKDDPSHGG